ncbi:MAG: hypothetical protein R2710_01330 [Acidimicrobiales bacterium]
MDIILMPGLWLPSSIWADVQRHPSRSAIARPPLRPGADDRNVDATLDDQLAAAPPRWTPPIVHSSSVTPLPRRSPGWWPIDVQKTSPVSS